MKKILFLSIFLIILFTGCENVKNTPTAKVENFLSKYQNRDKTVLEELHYVIDKDKTMNDKQKELYKTLLEKQYQYLSYKITNEEIIYDKAIVNIEIEVLDYKDTIKKVEEYYQNHVEEFPKENDYMDFKLQELKKVKSTIQYKMSIHLTKEDNKWKIEDLTSSDRKKIHGLY